MLGRVNLVGAGPGDLDLITVKGLKAIKEADVLIYDYLASKELLRFGQKACEKIYVGKKAGDHTMSQEDICTLIAHKAEEGKIVTRLKGGDPYVFGRGGEEAIILKKRGIPFEVVPGVTSSIGGLAYAGIPVTHRGIASSFHVMTGHFKSDEKEWDYESLVKLKGTLVFLMGMKNLSKIVGGLVDNGKSKTTPVAIINWATHKKQRVGIGTLENIEAVVAKEGLSSPSLIVVGEVVNLRESLSFFENKPLFSKRVLVTRSRSQVSNLSHQINRLGGEAIEFPTIQIEKPTDFSELDKKIQGISGYSHLVFLSQNSVVNFMDRLNELGKDARALYNTRIAVVGNATMKALKSYGIQADIIPKRFVSSELVAPLKADVDKDSRVLVTCGSLSRGKFKSQIESFVEVEEVCTYVNHIYEPNQEALEMINDDTFDYVTFSSSSTVDNFVKIMGEAWLKDKSCRIISIGPMTSKTLESYGITSYTEAKEHNIEGMIDVLTSN